jgi:UDP-N-acetylglucosamine 2-epimerase (non-hydrolysing)
VPCLTVRPNTERPVTVSHGTNRLVAPTRESVVAAAAEALAGSTARTSQIERWDGKTAERIVQVVCDGGDFTE